MKIARVLPKNPTLYEQLKLLNNVVLIKHPDFDKKTTGVIASLFLFGSFWVVLDVPYKKKNGDYSRKRMFKPDELRLI